MKEKNKNSKNIIEHIIDAVTVLTLIATALFAIVGICFNIVYTKTYVKGFSMYPTLNLEVPKSDIDGDVVFINKYAKIKKDDIVVANVTWWHDGPIIKRIVAGPGDVLRIAEEDEYYILYVNGKLVQKQKITTVSTHNTPGGTTAYYQKYLDFLTNPEFKENVITINNEPYILCNKNEYFLMGDNWSESTDCMEHGPVTKNRIAGRVERIVPYRHSHTFAMIKEMFAITFIPNWAN